MITAQWQIDAKFGHKSEVIKSLKKWQEEIGSQLGWKPSRVHMMTGSIGANESTVVMQIELDSLSDLDKSWDKLNKIDAHEKWSKDLEKYIVSGSHRWKVYRGL